MKKRKVAAPVPDPPRAPGLRAPGPAFLLAQLGAHAAARFGERLAALELTPPHAGILRAIAASEGTSQQALARLLGIVPSRLVELLDALSERGLVERRDHADDRRVYALHLTRQGRLALEGLARVGRDHQDALLAALTAQERATLAALLARIAEQQGLTPGVHPGYARLERKPRSR